MTSPPATTFASFSLTTDPSTTAPRRPMHRLIRPHPPGPPPRKQGGGGASRGAARFPHVPPAPFTGRGARGAGFLVGLLLAASPANASPLVDLVGSIGDNAGGQ